MKRVSSNITYNKSGVFASGFLINTLINKKILTITQLEYNARIAESKAIEQSFEMNMMYIRDLDERIREVNSALGPYLLPRKRKN